MYLQMLDRLMREDVSHAQMELGLYGGRQLIAAVPAWDSQWRLRKGNRGRRPGREELIDSIRVEVFDYEEQ
jgi:hypothetical protein